MDPHRAQQAARLLDRRAGEGQALFVEAAALRPRLLVVPERGGKQKEQLDVHRPSLARLPSIAKKAPVHPRFIFRRRNERSRATESACILLQMWHATSVAGEQHDDRFSSQARTRDFRIAVQRRRGDGGRGARGDEGPALLFGGPHLARPARGRAASSSTAPPTRPMSIRACAQPAKVRESALKSMVRTFFDGSAANAATALLGPDQEPVRGRSGSLAEGDPRSRGA